MTVKKIHKDQTAGTGFPLEPFSPAAPWKTGQDIRGTAVTVTCNLRSSCVYSPRGRWGHGGQRDLADQWDPEVEHKGVAGIHLMIHLFIYLEVIEAASR